ncbi:MAG TPA: hypothetical protein VKC63_04675 [Solirubrobacterales bacterium]|nr:hypothetical protein [Solirubrobacterales bacterium]
MAAAATARKTAAAPAPARRRKRPLLVAAPAPAPARKAPVHKPAPARRKAPARRPGGQLIPLAVGTASAVRSLPDSSLMVRMTRGRVWIGVLGVLLAGIVALNVLTLSLAAGAGHIDQNIQALDEENSILRSRDAQKSGASRIRHDAAGLGLSAAAVEQVGSVRVSPHDVETAARRLAAAETAY